VLEEAFGPDALLQMQRLTPEATSAGGLAEELGRIEKLFAGAAATANREIGMPTAEPDEAVRCFTAWRSALGADKDVGRDARMMLPVFYDEGRHKTKVWTFLGWRTTDVDVEYRVAPTIVEVRPAGSPPLLFTDESHRFAVPVMAEVYVKRLLDRDEFRRHCDQFETKEAILANLH
jgi:hypothetical protein